MAKHKGILKLSGKVGNLVFTPDGRGDTNVRKHGGPSKKQFNTLESMQRTRENASDFSRAGRLAGQLKRSVGAHVFFMSDSTYHNRLTGLLNLIAHTDGAALRGLRHPLRGDIYLLEGFEFNAAAHLERTLLSEYGAHIDSATGDVRLDIASFIPGKDLKAPAGATHFQLIMIASVIHPEEKNADFHLASQPLPIDAAPVGPLSLSGQLSPGIEEGVFVVCAGVLFFGEIDEVLLSIPGGAMSLLRLEKINHIDEYPDDYLDLTSQLPPVNDPTLTADQRNRHKAHDITMLDLPNQFTKLKLPAGPMNLTPGQSAQAQEKRLLLLHRLWLQKLDKYRKG